MFSSEAVLTPCPIFPGERLPPASMRTQLSATREANGAAATQGFGRRVAAHPLELTSLQKYLAITDTCPGDLSPTGGVGSSGMHR